MDVTVVREYLDTRHNRQKLESQFKRLEKQLSDGQVAETELLSKINPDSLITSKSVKIINELLSHRPLWLNAFPVSFAHLTLKGDNLHLSVVFAQPLFRGWRTETPYRSYQLCPLSLGTPTPPDENHIPEYISVSDNDINAVCWEQVGEGLWLWSDSKHGIEFCQESQEQQEKIVEKSIDTG